MRIQLVLSVLALVVVSATVVAGEVGNSLVTPESKKSVGAVFPDGIGAIEEEMQNSGLSRKVATQIAALIQKCRGKMAEEGAVNKTNAEACRGVWVIAIQFVRDTNDDDARKELVAAWNATFLQNDIRQALLQLSALGEIWEKRLLSKALLAFIDRQAIKHTQVLDAFGYAVYKSGDEDGLSYLREFQKRALLISDSIQKVLNWSKYEHTAGQTTPGPAEAPPKRVDLSEIDAGGASEDSGR